MTFRGVGRCTPPGFTSRNGKIGDPYFWSFRVSRNVRMIVQVIAHAVRNMELRGRAGFAGRG